MSNISFDNPWLLFIFIPLSAIAIVPFCIAVRKENRNGHNVTALVLHLVMCLCVTLALSGVKYESVITETNVYVLADVSYSAEHSLDDVQNKLEQVADKLPKNSKMGVICFGRNVEQLSDMGASVPNVRDASKVDRSATDIGSAIRYAGNLFDDDVIKRIIVITDGRETAESNNLVKIVSSLQNDGVYIDAVYLDDNLPEDVSEAQIDAVDVTSYTYLDKAEEAKVMVRVNTGSAERIDGYVSLYKDNQLVSRKTSSFYDGLNVVSLPLVTNEAGLFEYEVRIDTVDPQADYSSYNNYGLFTQRVTDRREILFVGGSERDVEEGRRIYGDDGVVYVTNVDELPLSVQDMCRYDEIALCNFDVRKVDSYGMFLSSLKTLVNDYGKTLSTYGNTFLQENDGTSKPLNQYAELLPFNIGNPDQESRLFAIVLDISSSTNFESRLKVVRNATVQLLQSLNATDMVMVTGFAGVVRPLLDPTYLTSLGVIVNTIEKVEVENETNLSSALSHTYDLMPKRFYDRRMIVISDGVIPKDDYEQSVNVAQKISKDGIALSALTVYAKPEGRNLFDRIVKNQFAQKGVFYQNVEHESEIDVIISDMRTDTREIVIQGGEYEVTVRRSYDSAVQGVSAMEAVNGFYYCSAKSSAIANTVLTVKYFRDKVTSFDAPLYLYYALGKGRVTSFMSDISSDWTAKWSNSSQADKFLKNLSDANLPNERVDSPFILTVEGAGSSATVYVDAPQTLPDSDDFTVTITDPEGMLETKKLALQAGRYYSAFNADVEGVYSVLIEYRHGDLRYTAQAELSIPYRAEYDSFESYNKAYLYRLLTENGSILDLNEIDKLENNDSYYTTYVFEFTAPLMILCAVLFVADIIVRQLKWKDVKSFFKGLFGRRSNEK